LFLNWRIFFLFSTGDWFGYVTPEKVKDIVDSCVENYDKNGESRILPELWRGRLGLSKDDVKTKAESA